MPALALVIIWWVKVIEFDEGFGIWLGESGSKWSWDEDIKGVGDEFCKQSDSCKVIWAAEDGQWDVLGEFSEVYVSRQGEVWSLLAVTASNVLRSLLEVEM